jgi:hypothetical protein
MAKKQREARLGRLLRDLLPLDAEAEFQGEGASLGGPRLSNGAIIARQVMAAACAGKQWAIELVRDSTEGKPGQAVRDDSGDRQDVERLDSNLAAHLNGILTGDAPGSPVAPLGNDAGARPKDRRADEDADDAGIDGGHDALMNKSRDMGASWISLAVLQWYWQFKQNVTFKELSRTEDYVDKRGDMDSLFEKHRYLLRMQPSWLRPKRIVDNHKLLRNVDRGNELVGESTNEDASRGGRKTAIFLDEFAAVDNGAKICAATADATACRIFNSTPGGPGTEFSKIYRERRARIIEMPWWTHPEKGNGAHQVFDDRGRPKWVSPWYYAETKRRDKKEMAVEVDMNHAQAGDMFFDESEVEAHRRLHAMPPMLQGNLSLNDDFGEERKKLIVKRQEFKAIRFLKGGERPPLSLWIPLVDGRPMQSLTYCFGVDIATGSGASNSVVSIGARELGQKVGEYATPHLSPEALAEMVAWLGIWFGGLFAPVFTCFELNGPGVQFGRKLVKLLGYPNYYRQKTDNTKQEASSDKYGWFSNDKRKLAMVGDYREALAHDRIIIPNEASLNECLDYVLDENGCLIPGRLKQETNGARATHGDRVIADALMWHAFTELPKQRDTIQRAPYGSYGWRQSEHRKAEQRKDEWA